MNDRRLKMIVAPFVLIAFGAWCYLAFLFLLVCLCLLNGACIQ